MECIFLRRITYSSDKYIFLGRIICRGGKYIFLGRVIYFGDVTHSTIARHRGGKLVT